MTLKDEAYKLADQARYVHNWHWLPQYNDNHHAKLVALGMQAGINAAAELLRKKGKEVLPLYSRNYASAPEDILELKKELD